MTKAKNSSKILRTNTNSSREDQVDALIAAPHCSLPPRYFERYERQSSSKKVISLSAYREPARAASNSVN